MRELEWTTMSMHLRGAGALAVVLAGVGSSQCGDSTVDASPAVAPGDDGGSSATEDATTGCTTNADCARGLACIDGACKKPSGDAGSSCKPSAETCDGKDNDCDGVVDNADVTNAQCAAASKGLNACTNGACACAVTCGGVCVDANLDPRNCGGCGKVCAATETCSSGKCANHAWADWKMPNTGSSLPNQASMTATVDVVTDNITGLQWQRVVQPPTHVWADAFVYCEGLVLGGHSDWRVPSPVELLSIVDFTQYQPAIDAVAFPGTPSGPYWTSTATNAVFEQSWYVDFGGGAVSAGYRNAPLPVRCVR